MPPVDPTLGSATTPFLTTGIVAVLVVYLVATLAALVRPIAARWILRGGIALHLALTVARGLAIGSFPLTSKMESFSGAALALAVVIELAWHPSRSYLLPQMVTLLAATAAASRFPQGLRRPVPPLQTIWYPLHVPLSFLSYACWAAAAAAAIAWWRHPEEPFLEHSERLALRGFGIWSVSMVFGGIWGVVAWGAWFLWDPKVVWSVILWFHYASFVHLKYAPSAVRRPGLRAALAVVGFLWVLVAFVGTSFFFGGSSHAF